MRFAVAGAVAVAATICATAAWAQTVPLRAGETVWYSGTEQWKVLACRQRPGVTWRECEMELLDPAGRPAATPPNWFDEEMIVTGDARIRRATGKPARAGMESFGRCVATPYFGTVPGDRPPSAALFRQKIADLYTFRNKAGWSVGVTFERFAVGAPVRNVVRQVPGVGAKRLNDAAPPGATMYPVASTYTVCEGGAGSGGTSRYVNSHYCFVDRDGSWGCGGGGGPPPQITRIARW